MSDKFKATMLKVLGAERVKASLEAAGVHVNYERKLVRISNARYTYRGYGAELTGGTCHYETGYYVTGKTFGIKSLIKSMGGQWKPKSKAWFFKLDPKRGGGDIACEILKRQAMNR